MECLGWRDGALTPCPYRVCGLGNHGGWGLPSPSGHSTGAQRLRPGTVCRQAFRSLCQTTVLCDSWSPHLLNRHINSTRFSRLVWGLSKVTRCPAQSALNKWCLLKGPGKKTAKDKVEVSRIQYNNWFCVSDSTFCFSIFLYSVCTGHKTIPWNMYCYFLPILQMSKLRASDRKFFKITQQERIEDHVSKWSSPHWTAPSLHGGRNLAVILLWTEQENQGFNGGMKGSKEMRRCWQEGLLYSEWVTPTKAELQEDSQEAGGDCKMTSQHQACLLWKILYGPIEKRQEGEWKGWPAVGCFTSPEFPKGFLLSGWSPVTDNESTVVSHTSTPLPSAKGRNLDGFLDPLVLNDCDRMIWHLLTQKNPQPRVLVDLSQSWLMTYVPATLPSSTMQTS